MADYFGGGQGDGAANGDPQAAGDDMDMIE
jgi:hypothetical protein